MLPSKSCRTINANFLLKNFGLTFFERFKTGTYLVNWFGRSVVRPNLAKPPSSADTDADADSDSSVVHYLLYYSKYSILTLYNKSSKGKGSSFWYRTSLLKSTHKFFFFFKINSLCFGTLDYSKNLPKLKYLFYSSNLFFLIFLEFWFCFDLLKLGGLTADFDQFSPFFVNKSQKIRFWMKILICMCILIFQNLPIK